MMLIKLATQITNILSISCGLRITTIFKWSSLELLIDIIVLFSENDNLIIK
jgi:hypothetical protein